MNFTQDLGGTCCDGESRFVDKICQVAELVINETKHRVYNKENVIGRIESCDILIDNPAVSSRHAVIEVEDRDSHVLYDLGSTNKTKLGKMTLKPHIRYHIRDCETLMFGNVIATYKYVESRVVESSDQEEGNTIHDNTPPVIIPESPERLDIPSGVVPETPAKGAFVAESVIETSTDLFLENETPHKSQDIYGAETETLPLTSVDESTANDSNVGSDIYEMATQIFDVSVSKCNNQTESDLLVKNNQNSPLSQPKVISSSINRSSMLDCCVQENDKKVLDSRQNQKHDGASNRINNIITEKTHKLSDVFTISIVNPDNEFSISEVPTQTFEETVNSVGSKHIRTFNCENSCEIVSDDCNFTQMMTQAFPINSSNKPQGLLEENNTEMDKNVNKNCEKIKHCKSNLNLSEMLTQAFTGSENEGSAMSNNTEINTQCDSIKKSKQCISNLSFSEMLTQAFTGSENIGSATNNNTELKAQCDTIKKLKNCKSNLNFSEMLTQTFTGSVNIAGAVSNKVEVNTLCDSVQKSVETNVESQNDLNISELQTQPFLMESKNTDGKKITENNDDFDIFEMATQPFLDTRNSDKCIGILQNTVYDVPGETVQSSETNCENIVHEVKLVEELDNPLNSSVPDMFTQPLLTSNCVNVIDTNDVIVSNLLIDIPSESQSKVRNSLFEAESRQCFNSPNEKSDCAKDLNEFKPDNKNNNIMGNINDEALSELCTQPFPKNNIVNINKTDFMTKNNVNSEELIQSCINETNNSILPGETDILVNEEKNLKVADSFNEHCQNTSLNNSNINKLNSQNVYDIETQSDDDGNISNGDQTNKSETQMEFSDEESSKIPINESASDMSLTCPEQKEQERSFLLMKKYSNYFSEDGEEECVPRTTNSSVVKKPDSFISNKERNSPDLMKSHMLPKPDTFSQKILSEEEYNKVLKKKTSTRSRKLSSDSESDSANIKLYNKQNLNKSDNKRRLSSDEEYSEVLTKKTNSRPRKLSSDSDNESANEKFYNKQNLNNSDNKRRLLSDEEYSEVLKKKTNSRPRKLSSDSDNESANEKFYNKQNLNNGVNKRRLSYDDEEYSEVLKKKSNLRPRKLSSDSENDDSANKELYNKELNKGGSKSRLSSNDNEVFDEVLKKISKQCTGKICSESDDRDSTEKSCEVQKSKPDIIQEHLSLDGKDFNSIQDMRLLVQRSTEKSKRAANDSTLASNTGECNDSTLASNTGECNDNTLASNTGECIKSELKVKSNQLSKCSDDESVDGSSELPTFENSVNNQLPTALKNELCASTALQSTVNSNNLAATNSTPPKLCTEGGTEYNLLKTKENDSRENEGENRNENLDKKSKLILNESLGENKRIETDFFINNDLVPVVSSTPRRKSFKTFKKISASSSVDRLKSVEKLETEKNDGAKMDNFEINSQSQKGKTTCVQILGQETNDDGLKVIGKNPNESLHLNEPNKIEYLKDISLEPSRSIQKESGCFVNDKENVLSSPETFLGFLESSTKVPVDESFINKNNVQNTDSTETDQNNVKDIGNRTYKKNLKKDTSHVAGLERKTVSRRRNTEQIKKPESEEVTKTCKRPGRVGKQSKSLNTIKTSSDSHSEMDNENQSVPENKSELFSEALGRGKRRRTRKRYADYDNDHVNMVSENSEVTTDTEKVDSVLRTRKTRQTLKNNEESGLNSKGNGNINNDANNTLNDQLFTDKTTKPFEPEVINNKIKSDYNANPHSSNIDPFESLLAENIEPCSVFLENASTHSDKSVSFSTGTKVKRTYRNKKLSMQDPTNGTATVGLRRATSSDGQQYGIQNSVGSSKLEDAQNKTIAEELVEKSNKKDVADKQNLCAGRNSVENENTKKRKCQKGQSLGTRNELSDKVPSAKSDDNSRLSNKHIEQHMNVAIKIEKEEPDEQPCALEGSANVKRSKNKNNLRKTVENEKDVMHEISKDKSRISVNGNGRKLENFNGRKESTLKFLKEESSIISTSEEESLPNRSDTRTSTENKKMETSISKERKNNKKSKGFKVAQVTENVVKEDISNDTVVKKRDSSAESPNTSRSGRTLKKPSLGQCSTHNIMFTGYSDSKMNALVKRLGGEIVDDPCTCTVLVTDKVRRTIKFLCSLAKGCPIVSPQWLVECRKSSRFVDPYLHLLSDVETEKKFRFNLKNSIDKAKSGHLLEGCTVYVTPSVKPPPEEMKSIIEFSGGTFLQRVPSKWPPNSIVISSVDDKSKWNALKKGGTTPPIVNAEVILTGVLQQVLDVNAHKIT